MTFSLFKKKKSVAGYKLNWHPSPPDPRDFKFADVQPTPDNITSVVDLKKIFFSSAALCKLRESELILIGQEMGLNTDTKKTKTQNAAIVAGGLGIK